MPAKTLVTVYAPEANLPDFAPRLYQAIAAEATGVTHGTADSKWQTYNGAVRAVLDGSFTHLLLCDSTIRPPRKALHHLLQRGLDVVAAATYHAAPPHSVQAFKRLPDGKLMSLEPQLEGLAEVDALGLGFVLISKEALQKIEGPWFVETFNIDGTLHESAQSYFCRKLQGASIKQHVDFDVSCELAVINFIGEQDAQRDWKRLMTA